MQQWRALELDLTGTLEGGMVFFRKDLDPLCGNDPQDVAWDRYCEISEQLEERGLRPNDVYLEHDCISGQIVLAET